MGLKKSHLTESVESLRECLSHSDALPQLVSLGVISGILAALVMMPVAINLKFFFAARYGCHDGRSAECSYYGAGGHPGAKPILGVITKINILNYYGM